MFLVGGAGRNSGKTTLSCALIKRFAAKHAVVGLKVTTVQQRHGPCPRGGDGCGVCSSLDEKYIISEELGDVEGKDTSLMVGSGATRVFWLRVLADHLAEGVAALRRQVGDGSVCICESNSLRRALEPDLFVIVKHKEATTFKPSAERVRSLADHVVLFDGKRFDPSPGVFDIVNSRWVARL